MSATAIRAPKSPVGSPMTPLLRAVLLADLVDSTAFIERFGDAEAAAALQRLDLQIRDLLAFTGGRLIDKADGLLAIFERPIQAVDFALRYQQMLRQFSDGEGKAGQLEARVGIHVGELMTWRNDDAAIAAGAKPLEVEGLAKPIAARLMLLALPGQILISSMAQTLAQRAQAELGERAGNVRWMVHGRYRFKGVPAPLLVHEVGEAGASPLRAPPSGQKVWRDIPLWRRPPVLAAELLVFLAVGLFYGYAIFRSPPALGFQERDWIVMGDVSNFTGDPRLEDALASALRISLEQSRYVNLLPDMKVQQVLQRMGRSRQAIVDRAMGSEIAVREGARAVFLPSIADDGGKLRVSIEVVDPSNQVTVFAESAEARGADSVMQSLDTVSRNLRERLGESMAMIKATGVPLEQATTSNLDALRAFGLALDAGHAAHYGDAMQLLDTAIALDPKFAMAYANRAQLWAGPGGDAARALQDYRSAEALRAHMTLRESMLLDVNRAALGPPGPQMEKVRVLARMYPDIFNVRVRAAKINWAYLQQYAQALADMQPALRPQNPQFGTALSNAGLIELSLDDYAAAEADFSRAVSAGGQVNFREHADVFAARRQYDKADAVLRAKPTTGLGADDLEGRLSEVSYPVDQGRVADAVQAARALQNLASGVSKESARTYAVIGLALSGVVDGRGALPGWKRFVSLETQHAGEDVPDVFKARFAALYGAAQLARLGDVGGARATLARLGGAAESSGYPTLVDLVQNLRAEIALASKRPADAIAALSGRATGTELCVVRATLLRAYRAADQVPEARNEAAWLVTHRGRAYAEFNSDYLLQPINVLESNLAILSGAELALQEGDVAGAQRGLAQFRAAWPKPPAFAAARIAGLEKALAP
jgi:putative peptide modification system cyclase